MTLLAALLLDALLGEPRWLWSRVPHPAVIMGHAVAWAGRCLNTGPRRRAKGILATTLLVCAAGSLGLLLQALPGQIAEVLIGAILLAQRSLSDHVTAVARALDISTADARSEVAMIVSRDTATMSTSDIARSAIESAAENLSDGVVAPVVWFAVAGLPGLMIYKVVNTADSMVGYLTPRYAAFGWSAARLDDLLNLVPARLTAVLIRLTAPGSGSWAEIAADARHHRSPNAGWPEAAMARAIGVALAGPRSYDGTMRDFPFVNTQGRRDLTACDIDAATRRLWSVWGLLVAACLSFIAVF